MTTIGCVRRVSAVLIGVVLWALPGCSSGVPDVRAFRDATVALRGATQTALDEAVTEVGAVRMQVRDALAATSAEDLEERAGGLEASYDAAGEYLEELRETRLAALAGMTEYASALVRVARAGEDRMAAVDAAAATARTAVETVSTLAAEVGGPGGGGAVGAVVKEGAGLFLDAARRAAKHLIDADTNARLYDKLRLQTAAVNELAEALEKDMELLAGLSMTLELPAITVIEERFGAYSLLAAERSLVAARSGLAAELARVEAALDSARSAAADQRARVPAGADPDEVPPELAEAIRRVEEAQDAFDGVRDRLGENEDSIATVRAAIAEVEMGTREASVRLSNLAGLARSCRDAARVWRKTHADIEIALRENATLSPEEIRASVGEVRQWLERVRAWREKATKVVG